MDDGRKIRVWTMVADSYGFVLSHPRDLVKVGWLPLMALFALNVLLDGLGATAHGLETATPALAIAQVALNILVLSPIAAAILVAWHRVVLLHLDTSGSSVAVRMGWREIRYLFSWLALSAVFLGIFTLAWGLVIGFGFLLLVTFKFALLLSQATGAPSLGSTDQFILLLYSAVLPAFLLASYFATRFSLVLPAMATDRQRSLGTAWSLSAGNGWRLVLAALFVMLPIELFSVGIGLATREVIGTALYYPLVLAACCCMVLLIVATGTVLSLFSVELDRGNRPLAGFDAAAMPAE